MTKPSEDVFLLQHHANQNLLFLFMQYSILNTFNTYNLYNQPKLNFKHKFQEIVHSNLDQITL